MSFRARNASVKNSLGGMRVLGGLEPAALLGLMLGGRRRRKNCTATLGIQNQLADCVKRPTQRLEDSEPTLEHCSQSRRRTAHSGTMRTPPFGALHTIFVPPSISTGAPPIARQLAS